MNLGKLYAGRGDEMTYQTVLDYLAHCGHLSAESLDFFRGLDGICSLDLRESLKDSALPAPPSFTKSVLSGGVLRHHVWALNTEALCSAETSE